MTWTSLSLSVSVGVWCSLVNGTSCRDYDDYDDDDGNAKSKQSVAAMERLRRVKEMESKLKSADEKKAKKTAVKQTLL